MIITERLQRYMERKGLNPNQITVEASLSVGLIGKAIKQQRGLNSDTIEKILYRYKDINPTWFITGEGEMLKSDVPIYKGVSVNTNRGIPLLPFDAFAGLGDRSTQGVCFDTVQDRYIIPLFEGIEIDFMLAVRGSSMYPKYSSGDVVACKLISELLFIQWNKVYVLDTITQGIVMKRIKKSNNNDCIICKSDNPSYDPFELPKSEIRNIALVIGVIRLE